jgi:hypothetical protein
MKKIVVACVLASILALAIVGTSFAHSKIETGNGGCVALPDSYHGDETRGHSGFGIGVAKGGTINPSFPPAEGFFPGNLEGYPTQSADSAILGGSCGSH